MEPPAPDNSARVGAVTTRPAIAGVGLAWRTVSAALEPIALSPTGSVLVCSKRSESEKRANGVADGAVTV